ncbi:MAG: PAS domain S-box protein [Turneriella sp.]
MREKENKRKSQPSPRQPVKSKKDKSIQSKRVTRSELPAAIRKLRLQNAKLERLLRVSPAAFLIVNAATGKILDLNKTAEDLLGISRQEALKNIAHIHAFFMHENDFNSLCEQLAKGKNVVQHLTELKSVHGNLHTVNLCATAATIGYEECLLFSFSECATDASSDRLLQNYYGKIANLEKALDASNLVSVTDAQGIIIYANAKFCEVSKYSRNELLGQNHRIINSGYHSKEFIRSLWKTITAGEVWSGEIKNRAKDGSFYWVNSTIVPFVDKTGKPYQYFAIRQDITERKRVAMDLERNREALLQAQSMAKLGSWEWLASEDKAIWSPELYRIYGVPQGKGPLTFKEIPDYYTPESWHALNAAVTDTLQQGKPFNIECEIVRTDKSHVIIIATGAAMYGTDAKIIGIYGTVQDVTEQKLAEERNRLIVNALPDLVFVLDRDGVFVDYHASEPKRLAYKPEFFLGKSFREIFDANLAGKMIGAIDLVAGGSPLERIEYTLPVADRIAHFEATFTPLDRERMMIVVRDTTERKQNELKMREQATLLDNARDAILVRNLDHTIEYWNKGAEQMYGWSQQEVLGKSVRTIFYTKPDTFDAATAELLKSGEFSGELEQKTRDGRKIIVQARWTMLKDDAGNPRSVFAINTDITERKNLEQQFLRAQRLESIGTLAGGIAHDLNNVLTPIMLATAVLKTGELKDDQLELLAMIEASVKHGTRMVRQVLSFARGAEGNPRPMQLETLLADLEPIIRDTFPRNIDIKIEASENLWLVKADFTQLHQVLMNLAVNARDAMPEGGKLILTASNCTLDKQYAGMQVDAKPGNYVLIHLEDSGEGMPADVIERIYEPFFTTKEHGKGTGLGLSTSLAIVKAHGGFMRVYSEPGRGTKFHVYLPALSDEALTAQPDDTEEMPHGNGELILVVDDEPAVLEVTKQTLGAFGYKTKTAQDGAEAIVVFTENKDQIAAVVTDMMMPVLDGAGAIRVLLKMRHDLPVIAVSGLDAQVKIPEMQTQTNIYFLQKPYAAALLLQTLKTALSKKTKKS